MSRYRARHSATARQRARTAPVRKYSRMWTAGAGVLLAVLVTVVVLTTGGWGEAVRTLSGDELKEQEALLRSQFETPSPEASASVESTSAQ